MDRWVGGFIFLFRGNVVDVISELLVLLGFGSLVVGIEMFILVEWFSIIWA